MRASAVGCNAIWSGNVGPTIPEHYHAKGRIKQRRSGQGRRVWRESHSYQKTRRRLATTERRLAAYRRSLHGQLANQIIRLGDDLRIEQVSYKGGPRCFGRSVGVRAPGRLVDAVKCVVARTRTAQLHEIPTFHTKLSQYCHRCGNYTRKPLAQRFHCCPHCGLGSEELIQRDLYSAARRESCAYACLGNFGCCETRYFATGLLPGRAAGGNIAVRSSWDNEAAVA
jgi:transposase